VVLSATPLSQREGVGNTLAVSLSQTWSTDTLITVYKHGVEVINRLLQNIGLG